MKWSRMLGLAVSVTLFSLGLAGVNESLAASAPSCGSSASTAVTMLARPGFDQVYGAVGSAYLDARAEQTMVGLRSLVEAISSAEDSVRWHQATRTATFRHNGQTLSITYAKGQSRSEKATLNDRPIAFTSLLCNGVLTAPARAVTDALGMQLTWHPGSTVLIDPVVRRTVPTCSPGRPSFWDVVKSPNEGSRLWAKAAACDWLGR